MKRFCSVLLCGLAGFSFAAAVTVRVPQWSETPEIAALLELADTLFWSAGLAFMVLAFLAFSAFPKRWEAVRD